VNGRLSALDDSFLAVESAAAHMHVGWAATFRVEDGRGRPSFSELRDHIEARLPRAPRYRQRLAAVPLGLDAPVWVDDEDFNLARHVLPSNATRLQDLVDSCMSEQLPRDRPLWQICIAERLEDERIGLVGKAHHCMVDGIAAVELGSLLLDPSPDPPRPEPDRWRPTSVPGPVRRLAGSVSGRAWEAVSVAGHAGRVASSPGRLRELVRQARRAAGALAQAMRPTEPVEPVNQPITPARHLAWFDRPFADLKRIGRAFGVSANDVLLSASAGGVRRFVRERGLDPAALKTMVPVNVRGDGTASELGNRISFVFIDLPCDEPDPTRRLRDVHLEMSRRKEAGDPAAADTALEAVKYLPRPARHALSKVIASPRTFNLTVSNIPGPREPMYMCGCELEAAYPVVPIADRHAVSIGMTSVRDRACFGVYVAKECLPDADRLAAAIDASIDELLEQAEYRGNGRTREPALVEPGF
jgi:diacylglycerol O-acyltransferase